MKTTNNVTKLNTMFDRHATEAFAPVVADTKPNGLPLHAILPGAPASLAAEFGHLVLQPPPARERRQIRPTWLGMAVVSIASWIGGSLTAAVTGLFW